MFAYLSLLLVFSSCCWGGTTLRTRPDGTFRIVQFTDLHYGESILRDAASAIIQGKMLEEEKPDIVVMTGDSVSGYAWDGKTRGWLAPHWRALTKPMIDHNVKWAFTFGNHDDQADLSRSEIVALDQNRSSLCLTQMGPTNINGTTNYILPIFSHDVNNPIPVAILYMLDSSDENCEGVKGWGCVYPNQVKWYIETATAIKQKYGKIIPAMAFFHIPVPEFLTMWHNDTCKGKLEDTGVCCFSVNTNLFAAFKQMGDVISVHCGHDHNNDFYGIHQGIMLAYGRKTGYGGYGPPDGWQRGARVLQIQESPFSLTHWIRQEDGSVVQSQQQPIHTPVEDKWKTCCDMQTAGFQSNCHEYSSNFVEGTSHHSH